VSDLARVDEHADDLGEPRVSYVVARLERALRGAVNERVREHGLTARQYTTLAALDRTAGGLSNAQLARRSSMAPQSMSEVIELLERRGLIERKPDPSHRRTLPATLTASGRRVLAACDESVQALEDEVLRELDTAGRAFLVRALEACVRGLGDR
jgi:DNA-binding MarR family transcriptional regulator